MVKALVSLSASVALLLGCTIVNEEAPPSPGASANTTTYSGGSGTTVEREEISIEASAYDPQAVQPEGGRQLSETRVKEAINIALNDPRAENFLRRNDFEISQVRYMEPFRQGGYTSEQDHPRARVTIMLEDPVPLERSGYRGAVCDVGGATGPVTGMVFNVDLVNREVSSFSPQWNYNVSCA